MHQAVKGGGEAGRTHGCIKLRAEGSSGKDTSIYMRQVFDEPLTRLRNDAVTLLSELIRFNQVLAK